MDEGTSSGSQGEFIRESYGDTCIHRNYPDKRVVHFSAAHCNKKDSCIDTVADACVHMKELLQSWREDDWHEEKNFLRLNKKKCEDLLTYLDRAKASYYSNTCGLAATEFLAAVKKAENLVEESSHQAWLLKAVELWKCSEHFLEVSLDLCWSSHIMSLGIVDRNSKQQEWQFEDEQKLLLNSWGRIAQPNNITQSCDDEKLDAMVTATLSNSALRKGGAEHQLACLLEDRLKVRTSWYPPILKSFSFSIRSRFTLSASNSGARGVVLRFPWVYKKQFAVKMRLPNSTKVPESFQGEFEVLDTYRSPYIVAVVGYWELESRLDWRPWPHNATLCPFLLMEAMDCDLEGLICNYRESPEGGFSPLETIKLMLPIAKALRFLHHKDVAHRDIKLQNIMCSNAMTGDFDDATVKLVDFGAAIVGVSTIPCDKHGHAGTHGCMDPEMWKKPDPVTGVTTGYDLFRADVFSFAMVFVRLLMWSPGGSPWGESDKEVTRKLNEGERPPLPSGVPDYVSFIVECCWCADPIARPKFTDICSMLQNAKLLLLGSTGFFAERDDLFCYLDGGCMNRSIGDRDFLQY